MKEKFMEKINVNLTHMREIEIFGFPALFTPCRVSRVTVQLGMLCYEIQDGAIGQNNTMFLTDEAEEDYFFGTVLTLIPIDLTENGVRPILLDDLKTDEGSEWYTPAEFERKYFDPEYDPAYLAERYGK